MHKESEKHQKRIGRQGKGGEGGSAKVITWASQNYRNICLAENKMSQDKNVYLASAECCKRRGRRRESTGWIWKLLLGTLWKAWFFWPVVSFCDFVRLDPRKNHTSLFRYQLWSLIQDILSTLDVKRWANGPNCFYFHYPSTFGGSPKCLSAP